MSLSIQAFFFGGTSSSSLNFNALFESKFKCSSRRFLFLSFFGVMNIGAFGWSRLILIFHIIMTIAPSKLICYPMFPIAISSTFSKYCFFSLNYNLITFRTNVPVNDVLRQSINLEYERQGRKSACVCVWDTIFTNFSVCVYIYIYIVGVVIIKMSNKYTKKSCHQDRSS
jgi:hypothetical protein